MVTFSVVIKKIFLVTTFIYLHFAQVDSIIATLGAVIFEITSVIDFSDQGIHIPFWGAFQPPMPPAAPANQGNNNNNNNNVANNNVTNNNNNNANLTYPPFPTLGAGAVPLYPPFPPMVPLPPVPTPPPNLTTLSMDELRTMEGNLRQAVEARIQTLQRVQLLLDAANAMMCQYQTAAATAK